MAEPYLDPRTEAERAASPWPGGVWIPLGELGARQHELPAPTHPVPVGQSARGGGVEDALSRLGRTVVWVPEESHGSHHLWSPSAFVMEMIPQIASTGSHVVDLGCGVGRDAIALANLGYAVTAIDRLPDAIERGRDLESRYRVGDSAIEWVVGDYRIEPTVKFDVVVLVWTFDRRAYEAILKWVRPSGFVVIESFSERSHTEVNHPTLNRCLFTSWPRAEVLVQREAVIHGKLASQVVLRV